jgi:uncharacterized protein (TIRG00374 family)
MNEQHPSILNKLKIRRIIWPVLIGLGVGGWLMADAWDPEVFRSTKWSTASWFFLLGAILLMLMRDVAYIYRIRLLSDNKLSWKQSFQIILLWEFSSALTPSVVGGSAVALYILTKEGISPGRTTAIVLITAFLDELFYVVMVPLIFIIAGFEKLFTSQGEYLFLDTPLGITSIFLVGYLFIVILILIIYGAIFFRPDIFNWILVRIFSLKILRRRKQWAINTGQDIITTSKEMKGKPFSFWLKAFGATVASWTARFWVVNLLILTITQVDDHFLIYARQLIMWVIMLISPTPGGSGIAEYIFGGFLGEFIPTGMAPAMALLWRLISYYSYLIIGAILLPIWVRRVFKKSPIHIPHLHLSHKGNQPSATNKDQTEETRKE